jgi:ABC-type transporter Mla subunit MlaD
MNKLDYLAQKEEELRKLNDQLDSKTKVLMENQESVEKEDEQIVEKKASEKDLFSNNQWMVNQIAAGAEEDNDYEDNFEEESPSQFKDLKVN